MPITTPCKSGGDRIRTCDLEVMSLASYLAAPPRDGFEKRGWDGDPNRTLIIVVGPRCGKVFRRMLGDAPRGCR